MSPESSTVESIFLQAVDLQQSEREAFLNKACGDNDELRMEVAELLRAHDDPANFFREDGHETDTRGLIPHAAEMIAASDDAGARDLAQVLSSLRPGNQLGIQRRWMQYELLEVLGRGGMSVVVRAMDIKLQRMVAIKIMSEQMAVDTTACQRFLREAKAVAGIRHKNVIKLHEVNEHRGNPFLVMELVEGYALDAYFRSHAPLPFDEVLELGAQIAAGLAACHRQGIIHRDIKPANILVEQATQRVKLTDFGLARTADDIRLTDEGFVAGTPMFMSPEQAKGEPLDFSSDLYSFGAVLYNACTGRPPFVCKSAIDLFRQLCEEEPPAIGSLNPDIPQWLAELVHKLLAKTPQDRFASAKAVVALFQCHFTGLPLGYSTTPGIPPDGNQKTKPKSVRAKLVGAALATVLGTMIAWGLLVWIASTGGPDDGAGPSESRPSVADPIHVLTSTDYEWTDPVKLDAINTDKRDGRPSLSDDGLALVFASNSPRGGQGKFDLWECQRKSKDDTWRHAVNLGPTVNSRFADAGGWLSADGLTLVYHSLRPNKQSGSRIWMSERVSRDQPWSMAKPIALPAGQLSKEQGPCVSRDRLTLIVCAENRQNNDLWAFTRKSTTAAWSPPKNLGPKINSPEYEAGPSFAADDRALLFHSNRSGKSTLWVSTRSNANAAWSQAVPLGVDVKNSLVLMQPFFHAGTRTLYFSCRVNGSGKASDLWMCRRVPKIR